MNEEKRKRERSEESRTVIIQNEFTVEKPMLLIHTRERVPVAALPEGGDDGGGMNSIEFVPTRGL